MKLIIIFLLAFNLKAQDCTLCTEVFENTDWVCQTGIGLIVHGQQNGCYAGGYLVLDKVTSDSLGVLMRDSIIITEGSFNKLELNIKNCSEETISAAISNADAIFLNNIAVSILNGVQDDIMELGLIPCDEMDKMTMEIKALNIKFAAMFLQTLRSQIALEVSGYNLGLWDFFVAVGDAAVIELKNAAQSYIVLLSDPCVGNNGQPLDTRLSGRIFRMDFAAGQLLYQHNEMKRLFKP